MLQGTQNKHVVSSLYEQFQCAYWEILFEKMQKGPQDKQMVFLFMNSIIMCLFRCCFVENAEEHTAQAIFSPFKNTFNWDQSSNRMLQSNGFSPSWTLSMCVLTLEPIFEMKCCWANTTGKWVLPFMNIFIIILSGTNGVVGVTPWASGCLGH